jgi:hypothetical protein
MPPTININGGTPAYINVESTVFQPSNICAKIEIQSGVGGKK